MNHKIDTFVLKWGFERGQPLLKECEADLLELIKSLMPNEEIEDWTEIMPDETINVPDELDKIVNKTGFQLRFHTISGKSEGETIAHIVWNNQKFFNKYFREHILNQLDPSK